jgi:hypothetical protein
VQVATVNGAAVITIESAAGQNVSAPSQQPDGTVWEVTDKEYKSGFVSSWNKFWCARSALQGCRRLLPACCQPASAASSAAAPVAGLQAS